MDTNGLVVTSLITFSGVCLGISLGIPRRVAGGLAVILFGVAVFVAETGAFRATPGVTGPSASQAPTATASVADRALPPPTASPSAAATPAAPTGKPAKIVSLCDPATAEFHPPIVGRTWTPAGDGWRLVQFWTNVPGYDQRLWKLILAPADQPALKGGGASWSRPSNCKDITQSDYNAMNLPDISLTQLQAAGLTGDAPGILGALPGPAPQECIKAGTVGLDAAARSADIRCSAQRGGEATTDLAAAPPARETAPANYAWAYGYYYPSNPRTCGLIISREPITLPSGSAGSWYLLSFQRVPEHARIFLATSPTYCLVDDHTKLVATRA